MWKRSMATDNQLVRGLGGSGRHCWANQKRLDQGATTGLLCVLQNGSPIFHSFLDTMLTQNTWCWWAGGVPWCHHFVGSNPHGRYHFVGVPIPFCREVGWAPYTLVGPTSRGEFQGGWKLDVFLNDFQGPSRTIQNKQSVYKMEGRHHIHKHDPRWHFSFKMVGLGPPINQILWFFFCAVGALHFVERDLLIHTQHHFIWEQDHMPVSATPFCRRFGIPFCRWVRGVDKYIHKCKYIWTQKNINRFWLTENQCWMKQETYGSLSMSPTCPSTSSILG